MTTTPATTTPCSTFGCRGAGLWLTRSLVLGSEQTDYLCSCCLGRARGYLDARLVTKGPT